jgi:DNA-binding NtrC family response regulator
MEKLMSWPFPGNIRELENILERARIYCRDSVIQGEDIDLHGSPTMPATVPSAPPAANNVPPITTPAAVPRAAAPSAPAPSSAAPTPAAVPSLDTVEKDAIIKALESCGGNRTKAAELLGISRRTILNKIRTYGL